MYLSCSHFSACKACLINCYYCSSCASNFCLQVSNWFMYLKALKSVEHSPNKCFHSTSFARVEDKEIVITEVQVSVPSLKCNSAVML